MISATMLTMRYGAKILFKNATIQLLQKNHYGLVGPNGAGKSTLLKILIGEITPDSGEIVIPNQCTVGTLKQDHFLYDKIAIRDVVLMGKPRLWDAIKKKETLLHKTIFTDGDCEELALCEKIFEELHGYSADSESAQILEGLGIPLTSHEKAMDTLSGGYKLRVLLAQLLFSAPDVLLLDEPTNHLDIFSIRWLEEYLKNFPGILLLSSHDKQFLNTVCNYIIDLDYGTLTTYKGNFDAFETIKEETRLSKDAVLAKQEKKKESLMGFVDRFGAKATKATQAQSKLKAVEKLEGEMEDFIQQPSSRRYPKIQFSQFRPSGAIALKVNNIKKSYENKHVLAKITFDVERGEKIAFVGANGIGKSTLLEILTNHRSADEGNFEWGHAAFIAYFPQDHSREVFGNISLLDWLGQFASQITREKLQQILALSLFSGDDVLKPVSTLSGGETARLILAKMMLINHNILIFDEPTNHLDMEATETLISALENYAGTVLFVSHNRHFVSRLAKRIIEMTPEGIKDFRGNYQEYVLKRELDHLDANQSLRNPVATEDKKTEEAKQNYIDQKKQQRNKEQLERKIEFSEKKCQQIENELTKINNLLCEEGFYQNKSKLEQDKVIAEKLKLENDLNAALQEWENFSEAYLNS